MFARIMAVVLAVILVTTVALSAVWWFTLRNQQIDARLDYLISEAEEIAYLAGDLEGESLMDTINDRDSVTRSHLNEVAANINREFGAYIAVMDQAGNVMTNARTAYSEDPEFVESLNGDEISEAMQKILGGEKIRMRSASGEAPTFTVGVPYTRNGGVAGAVFIRTKAQRIESGLNEILGKMWWCSCSCGRG